MIRIQDALFEDAVYIAHSLREADHVELVATGGNPVDLLLTGWQESEWCKVAHVKDKPAVIWGVRACSGELGSPLGIEQTDSKTPLPDVCLAQPITSCSLLRVQDTSSPALVIIHKTE